MPQLSLIICTYNRADFLKLALQSIIDQDASINDYEIVVINNNCSDNTDEVVNDFRKRNPYCSFVYAYEEKQGLSHSRNKAIEVSTTDWLAYIDDDARVDVHYTRNFLSFINQHKDIKAVGGSILLEFLDKKPEWYTPYIASLFGYFNPYSSSRFFSRGLYPRGSNMIIHRSLFEEVGKFNPNLGRIGRNMLGSEEKDFFQRCFNKGIKAFYLDNLVIYHFVPSFRTTVDFVKKQAIGVGVSEHIRIQQEQKGMFKKLFSEFVKMIISLGLLFYYMLILRPNKGLMLIRFRLWILKGLFSKSIDAD